MKTNLDKLLDIKNRIIKIRINVKIPTNIFEYIDFEKQNPKLVSILESLFSKYDKFSEKLKFENKKLMKGANIRFIIKQNGKFIIKEGNLIKIKQLNNKIDWFIEVEDINNKQKYKIEFDMLEKIKGEKK